MAVCAPHVPAVLQSYAFLVHTDAKVMSHAIESIMMVVRAPHLPACSHVCLDCCVLLHLVLCLANADAKVMNHAIESIMMAVGNGAAPTSRSWAVKIVYIAWAVFCVIMLAAYTVSVLCHFCLRDVEAPSVVCSCAVKIVFCATMLAAYIASVHCEDSFVGHLRVTRISTRTTQDFT